MFCCKRRGRGCDQFQLNPSTDTTEFSLAEQGKTPQPALEARVAALRFEVGTRVECNCRGWRSGTIVKQWYHDPTWPATKVMPYQIKLDNGPAIFAPKDSDQCIRRIVGLLAEGQIPVTVLTGFLGAGKTTLLNYILSSQHGKKYAVIENEFGDVAIDDQFLAVKKATSVESITVLDNGCLCCTVRDDLVAAIKDIVRVVESRYIAGVKDAKLDGILIETTGMADPGPIVKIFGADEVILKYCKIDGILTVVDCKHFLSQLHRSRPPDSVNEPAQQVAFADKILLNKVDACDGAQVQETQLAIRGINAVAPIRQCSLAHQPDAIPIGELLAIDAFDTAKLITMQQGSDEVNLVVPGEEADIGSGHGNAHDDHGSGHGAHGGHSGHGSGHDEHGGHNEHGGSALDDAGGGHGHANAHVHGHGHQSHHDTDIGSMVLEARGDGLNLRKFKSFLGNILAQNSADMYRYKGVLAVKDERLGEKSCMFILQGVHDMPEFTYSDQWPSDKPIKTQIVMIGRKLDRDTIRKDFLACFSS